ncbi:hypothetical protein V6N11_077547 [Hibiscus sabdariffa]|uniref:Uncharacterized protein n=1 Tax=Hibiscus sabdariffa TaxID=183260 RepID=A0ABR2TDH8_9ROSI
MDFPSTSSGVQSSIDSFTIAVDFPELSGEVVTCHRFEDTNTDASEDSAMTDAGGQIETITDSITQQTYGKQRVVVDVVPSPEANTDASQET